MKRLNIIMLCLFSVLTLLAACQQKTAPDKVVPTENSEGMQTYNFSGMQLRYPANAHIEGISKEEFSIVGPNIAIRPENADWLVSGAAYRLWVKVADNPRGLNAEDWARKEILQDWKENKSFGTPVTDDGKLKEDAIKLVSIAGLPAFKVIFFGGDSNIPRYYVTRGNKVVIMRYNEYPTANHPLAQVQQDMYGMIMGTLRFAE